MEILEKYKNYGFLEDVEDDKKEEISKLFEDFTNYLITEVGEDNLKFGDFDFGVIYIPLIKKLFLDYNETDYVKIFKDFKSFLESGVYEWGKNPNKLDSLGVLLLYLAKYKNEQ